MFDRVTRVTPLDRRICLSMFKWAALIDMRRSLLLARPFYTG
jgi:hypothetical protein